LQRRTPSLAVCLPAHIQVSDADVDAAYHQLAGRCGVLDPAVAVRSSALDEDSAAASFAGQHETFLNVRGLAELHAAIERCLESLHAPHALAYRRARGLAASDARLAVLVQQLVLAEASGVLFSANPMTGARGEAVVTTNCGRHRAAAGLRHGRRGRKCAERLRRRSARMQRVRPPAGKDATAFRQAGGRVQDWVRFELAPKWIGS
jgi:hypothetical protein